MVGRVGSRPGRSHRRGHRRGHRGASSRFSGATTCGDRPPGLGARRDRWLECGESVPLALGWPGVPSRNDSARRRAKTAAGLRPVNVLRERWLEDWARSGTASSGRGCGCGCVGGSVAVAAARPVRFGCVPGGPRTRLAQVSVRRAQPSSSPMARTPSNRSPTKPGPNLGPVPSSNPTPPPPSAGRRRRRGAGKDEEPIVLVFTAAPTRCRPRP